MKKSLALNLGRMSAQQPIGSFEVSAEVVNACSDAKARDVSVLDLSGHSDICEYFVIASGRSDRQVQGIANRVLEALDKRGIQPVSVEGFEQAHWVVIDCSDVVVHLFYEPVRELYDLESLWARARKVELHGTAREVTAARDPKPRGHASRAA